MIKKYDLPYRETIYTRIMYRGFVSFLEGGKKLELLLKDIEKRVALTKELLECDLKTIVFID